VEEVHPLEALTTDTAAFWVKQRVTNVIRSYHNAADVIAEPIQNAVDEVLSADGIEGIGKVRIVIDTDKNRIAVWDNGRGIGSENVARFLAPDIGTKRSDFQQGLVRGHKGVGLTFLAYGFDSFAIESRTENEHYILRMNGGRTWVESQSEDPAPVGVITRFDEKGAPQPSLQSTGTIVTIELSPLTEPKNLRLAFPDAAYTVAAIQNQTAVGLIEPPMVTRKRELQATLEYHAHSQAQTKEIKPSYRYPHMETPVNTKVLDLGAWIKQNNNTDVQSKYRKAYHACYRIYQPDELISLIGDRPGENFTTMEEVAAFVNKHQVHVYCLFAYSASYRDLIREAWKIPGNRKTLFSPSLKIASDGMISSWSREVALTHRGFNVDRTWLVYNFRGVEPDLGRKDFPPDVRDFIALTEELVANEVARDSKPFLRISPPRGGGNGGDGNWVAPNLKAHTRRQNALSPSHLPGYGEIRLETEPDCEQDVVALFSELVGLGPLKHFRPVFYSGFDYYDSYFSYDLSAVPQSVSRVLPGVNEFDPRDIEGAAEFKFIGDSIIDDTIAEVKRWNEMRFLVCWSVGKVARELGGDEITFDPPSEPINRQYAGVTHLARLQSAGDHTLFVIALKDFLKALTVEDI
jgi:anti-sigma regulatory factor (Ser/Thr protein kinase)